MLKYNYRVPLPTRLYYLHVYTIRVVIYIVLFLLAIVLSVLRFTESDYLFGIFNLSLHPCSFFRKKCTYLYFVVIWLFYPETYKRYNMP